MAIWARPYITQNDSSHQQTTAPSGRMIGNFSYIWDIAELHAPAEPTKFFHPILSHNESMVNKFREFLSKFKGQFTPSENVHENFLWMIAGFSLIFSAFFFAWSE